MFSDLNDYTMTRGTRCTQAGRQATAKPGRHARAALTLAAAAELLIGVANNLLVTRDVTCGPEGGGRGGGRDGVDAVMGSRPANERKAFIMLPRKHNRTRDVWLLMFLGISGRHLQHLMRETAGCAAVLLRKCI